MGTDKALLRLGSETLLERSVHTLESVCTSVVICGGEADRYTLPGIRCLADPLPDAGPLGGLLAALEAAEAGVGTLLVLACDLPFVTPSLMKLLLSTEPNLPVLIARSAGVTQPLCGRYATSLAPALRAFLERGERKVLGFVSASPHTYLTVEQGHPLFHPSLLSNINLTDDLAQAAAIMQRGTTS